MKTIDEYAMDIILNGAESFREDDIDEDGDLETDEQHDKAVEVAGRILDGIRAHREKVLGWAADVEEDQLNAAPDDGLTTPPTPQQVLDCPMSTNDADATTIRDYLIKLLALVWAEGEGFDGKRPFGNSSWEYEVYEALGAVGFIDIERDDEGDIEDLDRESGNRLIGNAIRALGVAS